MPDKEHINSVTYEVPEESFTFMKILIQATDPTCGKWQMIDDHLRSTGVYEPNLDSICPVKSRLGKIEYTDNLFVGEELRLYYINLENRGEDLTVIIKKA